MPRRGATIDLTATLFLLDFFQPLQQLAKRTLPFVFTAGLVGQLMLVHTVDILVCTVLTMYVQSMIRRGNSPYAHLPVTILFDYTVQSRFSDTFGLSKNGH